MKDKISGVKLYPWWISGSRGLNLILGGSRGLNLILGGSLDLWIYRGRRFFFLGEI
jgi:hypothetical protein